MAEAYLTAFTGLYYLFPFETIKAYVGKTSYLDYLVNVLLHCLEQPPPPVNDTNPYNVFRPREKVHRLHTRRVGCLFYACAIFFLLKSNWRKKNSDKALLHLQMQRRENNVQSFEKLRQVSEAPEPLWFFNFLKSEQFTFTVPSFSFSLDNIVFSAC